MPVKKVFLTGASGFIGGDALYAVHKAQPDWEFSVLIRDKQKAKQIQEAYPDVKIVFGSLDDAEIIRNAASTADIVIREKISPSPNHAIRITSAQAIADGLRATHTHSNPGYYIHIGGTGILTWYDWEHQRFGQKPLPKQAYDDLDGIDAVLNLPEYAWHRNVDKIVLAEASKDPEAVRIAIVCPPTIYGIGRGPISQRSRQIPLLSALTIENGEAPIMGDGLAEWDHIHIHDLSSLITLLIEHANNSGPHDPEKEIFGPKSYYFAANGTHRWGEIAEVIAKEAYNQGYITEPKTTQLSVDMAKEKYGMEPMTWGLNSKGAARRAKKLLGWEPKSPELTDLIPDLVRYEGERKKQGLKAWKKVN
ncbi:unnamed protein product [Clonostachys chloroleuca]|uniref:NAD(P)-binding domain-containing protein n=1 Tax=Clonostachys chloroleuca TaxID=1926264 RepID=A0AA35VLK9_9HYPO|nr:unnamed protein product [Clonostachys chloroleuca]